MPSSHTLYGIRYTLYDLLSTTDDIQVMQRGSSGISSVAESKTYYRIAYVNEALATQLNNDQIITTVNA